jgi:hypothetical protein
MSLAEFILEDMYELHHGLAEIGCCLTDDILLNDADLETYRESIGMYLSRFSAHEVD